MSDVQQEIEAYFVEYERRWNDQQDYSSLIEMWDQEDDRPFYRGMEKPGFFETWERLKLYWDPDHNKGLLAALWYGFRNIHAKLITPDVAVAYFDAEWDVKAIKGPALSGTDPTMAVFIRKADGWKMNTYVEACTHPAAYVNVFADQEDKVRPEFSKLLADKCKVECRGCTIPCRDDL